MVLSYMGQRTKNDPGFQKFMDDEADRMRRDVQEHLSAAESGEICAVSTADTDEVFCLQVTRDLSLCDIWSVR